MNFEAPLVLTAGPRLQKLRQIVIGTLAVIGVATVAMQLFVIFGIDCVSQPLASATSPDKERIARVLHRECSSDSGQTLELEIGVAVLKEYSSISLGPATTNQIGLTWRGNRWLIVTVPPPMEAFDVRVRDVDVDFDTAD